MIEILNSSIENIKKDTQYDLIIVALGFENRASYLANSLKDIRINKKICISLVDSPNVIERNNLSELGYEFHKRDKLVNIFNQEYSSIIVDYSVMMKSLYAEILELLINSNSTKKNNTVFFSYSHGLFEHAIKSEIYVNEIKPILLTDEKLLSNYNKTKLIISLGYERLSAVGLIENLQIDYDDVIVFINKENDSSEHYKECIELNSNLLSLLNRDQIFEVDFFDFNQISSILETIVFNLERNGYSAIIAPMSVKTFSFYSMVLSLNYNNTRFYNVTSESKEKSYQKFPDTSKKPLVYKLEM